MNAISCRAVAPPSSATVIPPSAPPANMSRTRSRLTTSPAANRPAAISQSNHAAMTRSLAEPGSVRGARLTLRCRTDTRATAAVVASSGARLPRRPVRGLGHRLAHRTHLLRRGTRRALGDTAHRVAGLPGTDEAVPLGWALTALRGLGERRFRLVLPVAGDVRGLPRGARAGAAGPRVRSGRRRRAAGAGAGAARSRGGRSGRRSRWPALPPAPPAGRGRPARGVRGAGPRRRRRRPHARRARPRPLEPRGAGAARRAGEDRRRRRACRPTTTRWRCRCWAGRSGWRRCSTWRWPTPRAARSTTPRRRPATRRCARWRRPCARPSPPRSTPSLAESPAPGAFRPLLESCSAPTARKHPCRRRSSLRSPAMTAPNLTMNRVIHAAVRRDLDRLATALGELPGRRHRPRPGPGAGVREPPDGADPPPRGRGHLHLADAGRDRRRPGAAGRHGERAPRHGRGAGRDRRRHGDGRAHRLGRRRRGRSGERRPDAGGRGAAPAARGGPSWSRSCMPHVESAEWKAVEKKLRSQPLAVAGRFFAWLTDGMSDEQPRLPKKTVPTPVVTVLARIFGRRYYKDVAPTWRDEPPLEPERRLHAAQPAGGRPPGRGVGREAERGARTAGCRAVGAQARQPAGAALLEQLADRRRRTPGGCRPSPRGRRPARAPRRSPSPRCRGPRSPRGGR